MSSPLAIRPARVEDAAQMARVNVRCWQETYRGLMPDAVLDDPSFLAGRERFWTAALTDARYRENRVAVAERDGELIGIAMSGPPPEAVHVQISLARMPWLFPWCIANGPAVGGHPLIVRPRRRRDVRHLVDMRHARISPHQPAPQRGYRPGIRLPSACLPGHSSPVAR